MPNEAKKTAELEKQNAELQMQKKELKKTNKRLHREVDDFRENEKKHREKLRDVTNAIDRCKPPANIKPLEKKADWLATSFLNLIEKNAKQSEEITRLESIIDAGKGDEKSPDTDNDKATSIDTKKTNQTNQGGNRGGRKRRNR
jgi:predicted  nucleic acid-binding Zn-ribbon protein